MINDYYALGVTLIELLSLPVIYFYKDLQNIIEHEVIN